MLGAASHVPVMAGELVDEVGRVGAGPPMQTADNALKVGVTGVLTVSERLAVVAHCPASGVNV